jgi:hypothetical protein
MFRWLENLPQSGTNNKSENIISKEQVVYYYLTKTYHKKVWLKERSQIKGKASYKKRKMIQKLCIYIHIVFRKKKIYTLCLNTSFTARSTRIYAVIDNSRFSHTKGYIQKNWNSGVCWYNYFKLKKLKGNIERPIWSCGTQTRCQADVARWWQYRHEMGSEYCVNL